MIYHLGMLFLKTTFRSIGILQRFRANLRRSDVKKNKIKINIPVKGGSRFTVKEDITNDDIPKPVGVTIERFRPEKI